MPLVYRKTKHGLEYRNEAPHLVAKRVAEGWCTSKADALAPKPAQPPVPVAAADAPTLDAPTLDVSDDDASPKAGARARPTPSRRSLQSQQTRSLPCLSPLLTRPRLLRP
jgi:hypothetical protein